MEELLLRGNPIGKINGILFDKDGTIVNSEKRLLDISLSRVHEAKKLFKSENYSSEIIKELEKLLLKAYGINDNKINPNGSLAIASKKDSLICTATVFCILGKSWSSAFEDATNIFEAATKPLLNRNNTNKRILPGLIPLIKNAQRRNIKLGLISNDTRMGIKEFLKSAGIEQYFPFIWSSDDYPPKPNPSSVKNLCKLMKLKSSECALIGDADTDMRMASQSGVLIALGYTAGWRTPPSLYEHHHLITHWSELTFQSSYKI